MTTYKTCAVPMCKSTTTITPDKLFIHVPKCSKRRKQWLMLAGRHPDFTSDKSTIYFCEDHFDLPNDMLNYTQYIVMGSVGKNLMKPGCLPSKFQCQPNRVKGFVLKRPQLFVSKRNLNALQENISVSPDVTATTVMTINNDPQAASTHSAAAPICDEGSNEDLPSITECTSATPVKRDSTPIATSPYIVETDIKIEVDSINETESHQDLVIPEGRELVVRVYRYLQTEYEQLKQITGNSFDLSPLANILQRTAAATGLTEHTVTLILEEARTESESDNGSDAVNDDPSSHEGNSNNFINCTSVVEDSSVNNFLLLYENEIKIEPETIGGELSDIIDSRAPHETADTTLATVKREPVDSDSEIPDPLQTQCGSLAHETPDTVHVSVKREPEDNKIRNKRRLEVTRVYVTGDVTPAVVANVTRKRKTRAPPD